MDINIKYYKNFQEIEKVWDTIYSSSSLPYFCSPKWHQVVWSLLQHTQLTKKINQLRYFTVTSSSDGEVQLAGFFYITNLFGNNKLRFGHLMNYSDYYDFIYHDDFNTDLVPHIIKKISKNFQAEEIQFNHLNPWSKLLEPLQNQNDYQISKLECVAVHLQGDYETYLQTLSKSVRQNLRTARNRVTKKELNFDYRVLGKNDVAEIDFQMLKNLYSQRNQHKNEQSTYWKTRILNFLDHGFSEEKDMFDIPKIKETDFSLGLLYLNTDLVAYFFGFREGDRIEINRVVINDEFRFYSPGLLLLNEYIKTEIPKGLKTFDLTLGDEKYKYDLGGETHYVYNLQKQP